MLATKTFALAHAFGASFVAAQYPSLLADPLSACLRDVRQIGLRGTDFYPAGTLSARLGNGRDCCLRTMDGTANNLDAPSTGAAGEGQQRFMSAATYSTTDGAGAGAAGQGSPQPSPRAVSAAVLEEVGNPVSPNLSSFAWVWLQFIDHDLTLVRDNPAACGALTVEPGDSCLPSGASIRFCDSKVNGAGSPINSITSFVDGSMVYGSSEAEAEELRGGGPGELLASESPHGPLLPPGTGGAFPQFRAGDERVNENPGLTALHTLFVREHNYLVREAVASIEGAAAAAEANSAEGEDALYEFARERNVAQIQAITYNEVLPLLIGPLPAYTGYRPEVDPSISVEFAILYRIGHSMVNEGFLRLDENGGPTPEGPVSLRDSFFNPSLIHRFGLEGLLRGLVATPSRQVDTMIVDGLRNFLFGAPVDGVSALDLGSLNIQRGRSNAVPLYNDLRQGLGLARRATLYDVTSDPDTVSRLNEAYGGDVNEVDAWVGALAEDHEPGTATGELTGVLLRRQFEALRDGDRFWYENAEFYTPEFTEQVRSTTLAEVITRNTDIGGSAWDRESFGGNVFLRTTAACTSNAGCGTDVNDVCMA